MNKRIAIFPGSFDPFTIGHANIVERALELFDEIIIGVGVNEMKRTLFSPKERVEKIKSLYEKEPRIKVTAYSCLTADFALEMGAKYILRGIRSVKDFEYERDIATMNEHLTGIETILLFTKAEYSCVSSSVVRELISFGKDVSHFLPKETE